MTNTGHDLVTVVDLRPRVVGWRLAKSCGLALCRAQVKVGSDVMIWAACKRTHKQYETSCGFRAHPREILYASDGTSILSTWPYYQYQRH